MATAKFIPGPGRGSAEPAPMLVQAHLRIRHRGCLTEGLTGGASATHVSGDRDTDIMVMHGPDPAAVERFLAALDAHAGLHEVMARTATSVVCRARKPSAGVLPAIHRAGCSVLWPAIYRDGQEFYTVVAPDRARFAALLGDLAALGDVEVQGLAEVRPDALEVLVAVGDLTGGLTPRQLRVLALAVRSGYYRVPRATTTEKLARAMGLARSTYDEHLRKAEQRVLERFGVVLEAYPGLAQGATRARGRPRKHGLSRAAARARAR